MAELLDFGDYPHIHADGCGEIHIINGLARFLQFRWRKVDGVWRPVVSGSIAMPAAFCSSIAETEPRIALALSTVPSERGRDVVH